MPVDVLVPPLGTNVDTLMLISWYRQEGDTVAKDEPLFVVETDKATLDVEAPASGILRRVGAQAGEEVAVLSRIAMIQIPGEALEDVSASANEFAARKARSLPSQTEFGVRAGGGRSKQRPYSALPDANSFAGQIHSMQTAESTTTDVSWKERQDRIFISPRAKRLAEMREIEWRVLQGTGPENAIVERDVLAFLEARRQPSISPIAQRIADEAGVDWTQMRGSGPNGKVVRDDIKQVLIPLEGGEIGSSSRDGNEEVREMIPVAGVRAIIAQRMAQSSANTTPVTLTSETDATEMVALRTRLRADGVAVSYNDILLMVLGRALQEHPRLNASLEGEVINLWKRIHIGLAVDAEQGLRVPVIRDVNQKKLEAIAEETRALIDAARQGKLPPDSMRGGSFTLTNLGMFGIDAFTPVINLPECAILGVGRIKPQPSVVDDQVVVRQKMWLSLTFDHRLVDGGPAARFLQRVAQLIEKPHLLLS
jgi:pyruvate dehydrogenase E2 component (dihydrolipoamide acetyltransferase)